MRRVQIGDLLALAGAVARQPADAGLAVRLCREAHAAHLYAKRFGRLHPHWGNGSLMSRVHASGGTMLAVWSPVAVAALRFACDGLALWRVERLDCRATRLCAISKTEHEESAHGGNPAQTE